MTKYVRGYRTILMAETLGMTNPPPPPSSIRVATDLQCKELSVYLFIWTYLFIGEAQCNLRTPLPLPEGRCGMVLDIVIFCSLDFVSFLFFTEDRVFWVGRSGVQQSPKLMFTKRPSRRAYPLFCCSYTWPPRKGLDFCICSRTLLCVFQDRERINLSVSLREENLQGEPVFANHASFSPFVLSSPFYR